MSKLVIVCVPDQAALNNMDKSLVSSALSLGATADVFNSDFDPSLLAGYDAAAFGFGKDVSESELISLFSRCLPELEGKKAAFFGDHETAEAKKEFTASLLRIGKAAKCVMLPVTGTDDEINALGGALVHKKEIRPDLANTVPIIFSTITGNAYKLAVAAADAVPEHVGPYNIRYINDEVIDKFDTFVLSYWCNHGTADDDTIDLIKRMHGKKLIVIGSLGVATDTAHAQKVCENVIALASEHNTLLGHYLCRGSIDLKRTFARTRIPEGQKGHLSMERFEKQKQSLGHPNAEELDGARRAVAEFLAKA